MLIPATFVSLGWCWDKIQTTLNCVLQITVILVRIQMQSLRVANHVLLEAIAALVVTRLHVKLAKIQQILLAVIYLNLCFAPPTIVKTGNMLKHLLTLAKTVHKIVLHV